TLDVVSAHDFSTLNKKDLCATIVSGIQANYTDPSTNTVRDCPVDCYFPSIVRGNGNVVNYVQIEALWDCGAIWDTLAFKTATKAPDTRPYVTVSWNSISYAPTETMTAGLLSVFAEDDADFSPITAGQDNAHEWAPGVTFNLTAGLAYNVEAGRRKVYANRATFLDLVGVPQAPAIISTFPILDTDVTTSDASITTLIFRSGFAAYNDEIYEEYLEKTVLTGIATTGGLYTAFNIVYTLLFGRSLLSAFTGGRPIGPFGKITSILQTNSFRRGLQSHYPGIDGTDQSKKAVATTNFLHDFVLDLRPLDLEPSYESRKRNEDTQSRRLDFSATDPRPETEMPEKGSLWKAQATTNFLHDSLLDLRPLDVLPPYETKKSKNDAQPQRPNSDITKPKAESKVYERLSPTPAPSHGNSTTQAGEELV
ncbi:hypothetical protein FRB90_002053, partial [Tulasnella sp. 427]